MATEKAVLLKHYRNLVRTITSFSNKQAYLRVDDEALRDNDDSLTVLQITIAPKGGPYCGGKFDFELDLSNGYPSCAPTVTCRTQVYHPNIDWDDGRGDVCLNLLDELWTSEMTLEDVVQGLLFLFYNPNIEDPLNSMFTGSETDEEFQDNIRLSLLGEEVDGVQFEANLTADCDSDVEEVGREAATTSDNPTESQGCETPSATQESEHNDQTAVTATQNSDQNSQTLSTATQELELNDQTPVTATQLELNDQTPVIATQSDQNGQTPSTTTQDCNQTCQTLTTVSRIDPAPCISVEQRAEKNHGIESSVDRNDFGAAHSLQGDFAASVFSKLWTSVWQYAQGFRITERLTNIGYERTTHQSILDFR